MLALPDSKGSDMAQKPRGKHARSSEDMSNNRFENTSSIKEVSPSQMLSESDAAPYQRQGYAKANKQRKQSKKWWVIFIIALVVFIGSLIAIGAIVYQYWAQQQAYRDLESHAQVSDAENIALSDLTVDWEGLRAINPDIVAWVYIPNTPVNYPVVQGKDNEEYLHRAFDGSTGFLASAGTIFLDANNSPDFTDQNNAMYGHHMVDQSMFSVLASWENSDNFNANRTIYVLTPAGNYRLKTFAVVQTTGSDAIVQTTFNTQVDFVNYIQDKLDRSMPVQEGDVLTAFDVRQSFLFSTCEYNREDGRAVVFASVEETTVPNNPYVDQTEDGGTTGITQEESDTIAQQYKEAA